jgi:hypothetical protein
MKKAERIELAKRCRERIEKLGLRVEVKHGWMRISPPEDIPADLAYDMVKCSKYLIKLFK